MPLDCVFEGCFKRASIQVSRKAKAKHAGHRMGRPVIVQHVFFEAGQGQRKHEALTQRKYFVLQNCGKRLVRIAIASTIRIGRWDGDSSETVDETLRKRDFCHRNELSRAA